jgi:hypothetical protein
MEFRRFFEYSGRHLRVVVCVQFNQKSRNKEFDGWVQFSQKYRNKEFDGFGGLSSWEVIKQTNHGEINI